MSKDIHIKRGVDIKLQGEAEKTVVEIPQSRVFAIKPGDFHGITPKLAVRVGDEVKAGDVLFFSKYNENLKFTSPVSGEVAEIVRGEKRRILEIRVLADAQVSYKDFGASKVDGLSREDIIAKMMDSGVWPMVKQRPYDVIANPEDQPKAIFISAYSTAPLAADLEFTMAEELASMQTAIDALAKLSEGKVHVSVNGADSNSIFRKLNNVEIHNVNGPHPAGNVGVQIHHIDPINKGEMVWVVAARDLHIIGKLFEQGKFDARRTVALTGSELNEPQYVKTIIGAQLEGALKGNTKQEHVRVISGDVLTGTEAGAEGFLGYYNDQVTVIEEGDNESLLFGWITPNPSKFSFSRALTFSWLTPKKRYALNTNMNGGVRSFVVTGEYEKVFPFDIYPMQLMKAIMINDIESMENLGIYEVAPEDFALTEFICPSKIEHQQVVRDGLDVMVKEVG